MLSEVRCGPGAIRYRLLMVSADEIPEVMKLAFDLLRDPPPNGMEISFISLVGFSHLSGLNLHSVSVPLPVEDILLTYMGRGIL